MAIRRSPRHDLKLETGRYGEGEKASIFNPLRVELNADKLGVKLKPRKVLETNVGASEWRKGMFIFDMMDSIRWKQTTRCTPDFCLRCRWRDTSKDLRVMELCGILGD